MHSDLEDGVNIGRQEYVSVDELVQIITDVSGKTLHFKHIDGPVGVRARNFCADRIRETGWESKISLREGISRTYPWIKAQVEASQKSE
jgi:nucleoside-diphosphate-sugar epimerase